jgi:hypothetical protein
MDDILDLVSLSDAELKALINELVEEEREVSRRRRILHGKIDILRAELVLRLQRDVEEGKSIISGDDLERLSEILAGKGPYGGEPEPRSPAPDEPAPERPEAGGTEPGGSGTGPQG